MTKGDIFRVDKENDSFFFFQFLTNDQNCLSANVIKVFDTLILSDQNIDFKKIINSDVKFYAHVSVSRGLKEKVWHKVSNICIDIEILPWFKQYEEIDLPGAHTGWTVWQVGGKEKYLGKIKLPRKYNEASIAGIRPPDQIIKWFNDGIDILNIER